MLMQSDLVLTTGRQFLRFYENSLPLKTFTVPIKFSAMRFYQCGTTGCITRASIGGCGSWWGWWRES